TDNAWEPPEAAEVGDQAALDKEFAEPGLIRGDANVAEERQIHPPPHSRAIDRGDDRLVAFEHCHGSRSGARADVAEAAGGFLALLAQHDLRDVIAGAEGATLAGTDDAAHFRVRVSVTESLLQLGVELAGEGVHRLGAVKLDCGDVISDVVLQELRHVPTSYLNS